MEAVQERHQVSANSIMLLLQRLVDSPQGLTLLTRGNSCSHEHYQHFKGKQYGVSNPEFHEVPVEGDRLRFSFRIGDKKFTTKVDEFMSWAQYAEKVKTDYSNPKSVFVQTYI